MAGLLLSTLVNSGLARPEEAAQASDWAWALPTLYVPPPRRRINRAAIAVQIRQGFDIALARQKASQFAAPRTP